MGLFSSKCTSSEHSWEYEDVTRDDGTPVVRSNIRLDGDDSVRLHVKKLQKRVCSNCDTEKDGGETTIRIYDLDEIEIEALGLDIDNDEPQYEEDDEDDEPDTIHDMWDEVHEVGFGDGILSGDEIMHAKQVAEDEGGVDGTMLVETEFINDVRDDRAFSYRSELQNISEKFGDRPKEFRGMIFGLEVYEIPEIPDGTTKGTWNGIGAVLPVDGEEDVIVAIEP